MADPNPDDNALKHVFSSQLKNFDLQISECRRWFESFSSEEQKQIRDWLEKLAECASQGGQWGATARAFIENEKVDEEGHPPHVGTTLLSPHTLLMAVRAWENGGDFTPDSVRP